MDVTALNFIAKIQFIICQRVGEEYMEEKRCPNCKKLLLKAIGKYKIEIKCPKCKNIIIYECQERH